MKATADKAPANKKNLLLLLLIPILIALGVVAGTFLTSRRSDKPIVLLTDKKTTVTVPLDEFLINLGQAENKRDQFVKLEISLQSTEKKADETIASKLPQIRDAIIYTVHQKNSSNLFEEKDGSFTLKEELKQRLNEALGQELVSEVYITNILMQ